MYIVHCVIYRYFVLFFLFFKQKTAYEMRISDWSSDVCSSDLLLQELGFAVSRAQQRSLQDEMMAEALQRLTARAEKAAAALGLHFDGWHRVEIGRASCRERVCQYV